MPRSTAFRMVPAVFPRPDLMVTMTGLLEILGAIGLLFPATASAAAAGLAVMLIALFPANARAARQGFTIGSKPATPLPLRTVLQIVFIAALIAAGFADHRAVWSAPAKTASASRTERAK